MRQYQVNRDNFQHDGQHVPNGESVELSDDQAKPLLALGAVALRDADTFTPDESGEGVIETEQTEAFATAKAAAEQASAEALGAPDAATAAEATARYAQAKVTEKSSKSALKPKAK